MADETTAREAFPSGSWEILTDDSVDQLQSFRAGAYNLVSSMYNISAAQKASLVPYIRMWVPEEHGFKPKDGRYLSNDFYAPPKFGEMSKGTNFGDRPDVSLEAATIKTVNAFGWKTYRELDFNITVHRPEAVFGLDASDIKSSTALKEILDFNNDVIIEYGWNGPPGIPLIDGNSSTGQTSEVGRQLSATRRLIRFKTTHYNFQLTPDGQAKFQIHGIENGEVATRSITIFENIAFDTVTKVSAPDQIEIQEQTKKFRDEIAKRAPLLVVKDGTGKKTLIQGNFIRLADVFEVLFTRPLEKLAADTGYKELKLQFGTFNDRVPSTTEFWGAQLYRIPPGKLDEESKKKNNIGEFKIPLEKINDIMGKLVIEGQPLTIDALMKQILNLVNDQTTWAGGHDIEFQVPEVMVRTVYDPDGNGKPLLFFQVVDRKKYIRIRGLDRNERNLHLAKSEIKAKINDLLRNNNIPKIDLYHQGSFIKTTNFSVTNDEQMKSMFIRRQIDRNRGVVSRTDGRFASNVPLPNQIAMLYRSAIKGDITMLGNFFFEVIGTMYIDFGIWAFNGFFYVLQKVDKIGKDGFETTVTVQAEGSDPLGVGELPPQNMNEKTSMLGNFKLKIDPQFEPKPGSTNNYQLTLPEFKPKF